MSEVSSFVNWWDMWEAFGPADRLEMFRRISLVFPDFSYSMLDHWYRHRPQPSGIHGLMVPNPHPSPFCSVRAASRHHPKMNRSAYWKKTLIALVLLLFFPLLSSGTSELATGAVGISMPRYASEQASALRLVRLLRLRFFFFSFPRRLWRRVGEGGGGSISIRSVSQCLLDPFWHGG